MIHARSLPLLGSAEGVEKVLNKAMARNPDDRYATTLEFAADLKVAAAGGDTGGGGMLGKILGR